MKTLYFLSISIGFTVLGCSSTQVCKTADVEPVSLCRAQDKCTSSGWSKAGLLLGSFGGNRGNTAVPEIDKCVNRDLEIQRSNALIRSISSSKD